MDKARIPDIVGRLLSSSQTRFKINVFDEINSYTPMEFACGMNEAETDFLNSKKNFNDVLRYSQISNDKSKRIFRYTTQLALKSLAQDIRDFRREYGIMSTVFYNWLYSELSEYELSKRDKVAIRSYIRLLEQY